MVKKRSKLIPLFLLLLIFALFCQRSLFNIINMPCNFYVNYEEIEEANQKDLYGRFVSLELSSKEINTDNTKGNRGEVVFKLFGLIPIKKVAVKIMPEEKVYVGGVPIGLKIQTDGVAVVGDCVVSSKNADVYKNKHIKNGDIIQEIDGVSVKKISDLTDHISNKTNESVELKLLRNGKTHYEKVTLIKNEEDKYRLGVWVKDDCSGIGTLTFVKCTDNSFGALGHAITNNGRDESIVPMIDGEVYACNLVNIEKGGKNHPGELQCVFVERDKCGVIEKNTKVGIYGKLNNMQQLVDTNKTLSLGGRLSVKPGKAKIVSSVSGIQEEYEIEIIKTNYQAKCDDKSFVFRVKDDRLLSLTGVIVQGMSGSPIVQNGKLVGAVTHVFVSDSTKGYGVYTDWMLQQIEDC